jgi:hypothetical protein
MAKAAKKAEPRAFTRDEYMHMQVAANMQHGLSPETAWKVADLQWRTGFAHRGLPNPATGLVEDARSIVREMQELWGAA